MGERGRGHVCLQHGTTWFLQFYQTENRDGKLVKVRKSVKLADKDREDNSATCKAIKILRHRELAITNAPTITDRKLGAEFRCSSCGGESRRP